MVSDTLSLDKTRATVNSNGSKARGLSGIFAIRANGVKIPLHLIFPGTLACEEWLEGVPDDQVWIQTSRTASGGTTSKVFLAYIRWLVEFLNAVNDPIPYILVMDNLGAHVTAEVREMLLNNNVILVLLPPWTSHFLQPLDVSVFRSFKERLRNDIRRDLKDNRNLKEPGGLIKKSHFAALIWGAWNEGVSSNVVKKSFRSVGIYPFDEGKLQETIQEHTVIDEAPVNAAEALGQPIALDVMQFRRVTHPVPDEPMRKQKKAHLRIEERPYSRQELIQLAQAKQVALSQPKRSGKKNMCPEPVQKHSDSDSDGEYIDD